MPALFYQSFGLVPCSVKHLGLPPQSPWAVDDDGRYTYLRDALLLNSGIAVWYHIQVPVPHSNQFVGKAQRLLHGAKHSAAHFHLHMCRALIQALCSLRSYGRGFVDLRRITQAKHSAANSILWACLWLLAACLTCAECFSSTTCGFKKTG